MDKASSIVLRGFSESKNSQSPTAKLRYFEIQKDWPLASRKEMLVVHSAREGDCIIMMSIMDYVITVRDGKYGVVNKENGDVVIPLEYDNIVRFYKGDDDLILYQNGKVGGGFFDNTAERCFHWITPCKYDAFEQYGNSGDLRFWTVSETRYYFHKTKTINDFSEIHLYGGYLYGIDSDGCKLMRRGTGEILWSMTTERIARDFPCGVPCLAEMGEHSNLPLFFDAANAGCIIPYSRHHVEYSLNLPHLIKPIIVNGENIVNIVGDQDGINAVEYDGRLFYEYYPCEFEEVTVELRLRLRKGANTEERIIQIPQGRFTPDSFSSIGDW